MKELEQVGNLADSVEAAKRIVTSDNPSEGLKACTVQQLSDLTRAGADLQLVDKGDHFAVVATPRKQPQQIVLGRAAKRKREKAIRQAVSKAKQKKAKK